MGYIKRPQSGFCLGKENANCNTITLLYSRKQILNDLCTKMTDFKRENKDLILQKKKNLFSEEKKKFLKRKTVHIGYLNLSCSEFHQK